MKKIFGLSVVLVLLAAGLAVGVSAQTSTVGSISGTVRDPQGAAVPGNNPAGAAGGRRHAQPEARRV